MTSANVSTAGPARVWRSFRRWRRSRPFWGGLLIALAGVEMFASTRMTVNGLSFQSGATGLSALLIPIILVTCGLLLWLTPAQRPFYSVVAAVTSVYSLMGLNLGGFFLGMLLGILGSALAFAWTSATASPTASPTGSPTASPTREADDAEAASTEATPAGASPAEPVAGLRDAAPDTVPPTAPETSGGTDSPAPVGTPATAAPPPPYPGPSAPRPRNAEAYPAADQPGTPTTSTFSDPPGGAADPRFFAVALLVLGLCATALVAVRPAPVQAAPMQPVRPAASPCPTRSKPAKPSPAPSRSAPAATPTASPTPEPERTSDGNIITDILEGIGDLLTGGRRSGRDASPTPTPTATAQPSSEPTTAAPTTSAAVGRPGSADCPDATATEPAPARPGPIEPGKPLPRIAADPDQPKVARTPSKLTGTSVTMTALRFEGVTDLPTEGGSLKVLKFSMRKAVTEDFLLRADGPQGLNQLYATDRLTVQGDVAFYTTRFVGRLLGIKVTLTPDLPFPDGIPVTLPVAITFTDPVIDLAYITTDTLTARPELKLSLG
ncbi:DUF6114 domain-containing protein [Micromonospora costi]|uniref:Uncharacterized protein n=1 Tax=Micromonospora costi TaxID=1530042 RepID=A0A3B0A1R0_9ACTN|nr:DUF6114 domain-containing protein [Micromonospora costi]RKN54588.1 hypothetical protein D7193_21780 [Micromonospora costi]